MAKARVLIAENESTLRSTLRDTLGYLGYEPSEAADGTEALAKAERLRPDLLLMDVDLPELNGYEVARCLKANSTTRAIPVIVLLGWQGNKVHHFTAANGAATYLIKPFRLEALVAAIEEALPTPECQAGPEVRTDGDGC